MRATPWPHWQAPDLLNGLILPASEIIKATARAKERKDEDADEARSPRIKTKDGQINAKSGKNYVKRVRREDDRRQREENRKEK